MKFYLTITLCFLAGLLSAQGLSLLNQATKAKKTFKPGQSIKLTHLAQIHPVHQLPLYQHTTGKLLQTTADSIYVMANGFSRFGESEKGNFKSKYDFEKNAHTTFTIAKSDLLEVKRLSKTRKTLGVIGIVLSTIGVSTLVSAGIVADNKSGSARLLKVGGMCLGTGIVFGIASGSNQTVINSQDCASAWVVE
jgi:hypothetical protein